MKKILTFILASTTLLLTNCKEEKKEAKPIQEQQAQSQMQTVMAIHDEVMPKMGAIGKLVGQLKPMVDTTETGKKHQKAMLDLQNANKKMMDWMQGFGTHFDSDEILNGKALTAEKKEILIKEKAEITEVKNAINSSISAAEELLKQ